MALLNNIRLTWKLWAAFSLVGLLLGVVAYDDYSSSAKLSGITEEMHQKGFIGMTQLTTIMGEVKQARILTYSGYNAPDKKEEALVADLRVTSRKTIGEAMDKFGSLNIEGMAPKFEALKSQLAETAELNDRITSLYESGQRDAALALIKDDGRIAYRESLARVQDIVQALHDRGSHQAEEARAQADFSAVTAITLAVVGIGLNILIWLLLNQTVAGPLARIAETTSRLAEGDHVDVPHRDRDDEVGEIAGALEHFRVAAQERSEKDAAVAAEQQVVTSHLRTSLEAIKEGDLTRTIDVDFPPAYIELKTNFNAALGSLRDLIGAVTESTQAIRTGSNEIAQASEDLARRTESNAASLEETSAAVSQMDERLHATAAAAGRTVQRADGAMSVVNSGRSIADDAVSAMGRVSDSAKGIDSVIEGLDKIAFQTRVLAMNAAVEAGRAGDAGRGFAVVADLVSALAMRSEEEAKRAREQLTATQTDIGTAVEAVQRVDGALQDISSDVGEVHKLLSEIATDNQAQSSTISQISSAIGTMDQATQQNAAMVEETSAAARNLHSEVSGLSERASMFRIGGHTATSRGIARPVAAPRPVAAARPAASAKLAAVPAAATAVDADDWVDF